jgi:hypothetical protein
MTHSSSVSSDVKGTRVVGSQVPCTLNRSDVQEWVVPLARTDQYVRILGVDLDTWTMRRCDRGSELCFLQPNS